MFLSFCVFELDIIFKLVQKFITQEKGDKLLNQLENYIQNLKKEYVSIALVALIKFDPFLLIRYQPIHIHPECLLTALS